MLVARLIPRLLLLPLLAAFPLQLRAGERLLDKAASAEHFEKRVRPLLVERCHKCHAGSNAKGGLKLDSAASVRQGGDSGEAVVPGKPEESRLIQAVRHENGLKMPPEGRLTESQVADLSTWVRAGAPWPQGTSPMATPALSSQVLRVPYSEAEKEFWAYQPVRDRSTPSVRNPHWGSTPIDKFILERLETAGLSAAPSADKRTLIRRATFDLTGLPPTPAEIDAFLHDKSPNAFEKVIERLLASPHYGERWGRHWLDVVRYGETTANDANAVMRYAWRYRNYVIDAFNRDLPYDEFLIEQLAGDLLPPSPDLDKRIRATIATGFLMVGPKALAETDKEQSRLDIVDDQIDVVSRTFLGLTVSCARCHDHKFDAIRTADYYALAGILRSTEPFQDESRNATMWWEYPLFQPPGEPPYIVMAPRETTPRDLRIHIRGNRFTLGQNVPRGFPQVFTFDSEAKIDAAKSGRLELARWIADKRNPLTARVLVNRVWQHHFGRGLVATSDNFGTRGERPSHPELLDFLATRFIESGWSIKKLHRQIMLSQVYQQGIQQQPLAVQVDPDNRWLSHFSMRRLSAEELRDAVLTVSGQLDPSFGTSESATVLWKEAEVLDGKRGLAASRMQADHPFYTEFKKRSVYLPIVRNMLPDVLSLFDGADPNSVTAVRNDTTVPAQSLYFLNSPFIRQQSRSFAERVLAKTPVSDRERFDFANRLAFGRPASDDEAKSAGEYIHRYLAARKGSPGSDTERQLAAWQSYCQMLLCSNEFFYVE